MDSMDLLCFSPLRPPLLLHLNYDALLHAYNDEPRGSQVPRLLSLVKMLPVSLAFLVDYTLHDHMDMRQQQMRGLHLESHGVLKPQAMPGAKSVDQPRPLLMIFHILFQACHHRSLIADAFRFGKEPSHEQFVELHRHPTTAHSIAEDAVYSEDPISWKPHPPDLLPIRVQVVASQDELPELASAASP